MSKSEKPRFGEYHVLPFSRLRIPSSRICHGVWKSGSPMLREITSCISLAMSKNLRIPDGLTDRIPLFIYFEYSIRELNSSRQPERPH